MQPHEPPRYTRHLEDATILRHADGYPEPLRQPFIWFAQYVRNHCRKDLEVLVQIMRDLGYRTTAGTYAKLLQGRWRQSATGSTTAPVIALEKFLEQVRRLQEHHRLTRLQGVIPFIKTPTFLDIRAYVDERRLPGAVCKFGLILGPTGASKTASFEHLPTDNPEGRYLHLEAPDTPTIGKFYTDLAEKFGLPRSAPQSHKIARILDNLTPGLCLSLDNVQRLYRAANGWNQPIFNFLQRAQDERRFTVILGAVMDFEQTLLAGGYFEQFEGRCGGREEFLILPRYAPLEDLRAIATGVGLTPDRPTLALMQTLSRKPGRLRILFSKLQKARQLAEHRSEPLTLAHLQEVCGQPEATTEEKP